MAILQQSSNTGGPITGWPLTTLAPAGQTFAVCLAVKDSMSIQRPSYDDPSVIETKNFTRFLFGLTDGTLIQTGEMTISLNEKSKLFKTLTVWNGTMPFGGFDTESMVGKGATLNIIHKTSQKGREYADISAIMPIMQGMEAQVPDRARFVIPTGDEAPAPIQQAPVVQPVQPMQEVQPATHSAQRSVANCYHCDSRSATPACTATCTTADARSAPTGNNGNSVYRTST